MGRRRGYGKEEAVYDIPWDADELLNSRGEVGKRMDKKGAKNMDIQ